MDSNFNPGADFEKRVAARLLDVLIRAGLILAMVLLCYQVFSPFLTLMVWALILAVTLYPMHQSLARRMGGSQGWAATVIVVLGVALIVGPTAVLMGSLGDSIQQFVASVQSASIRIPEPREAVAAWPLIGKKLYAAWTPASTDLAAFIQSQQPKIGNIAKALLGFVAGIGGGLLQFVASLIIAGIMMAFGRAGAAACRAIFRRIVGAERGDEFTILSTATIRAVAQGVIGVAFIQAIIVGVCLLVAGVPWAGVLAVIVLVLGIAQVPAVIVTLPAIAWIWLKAGYGSGEAILYTILLVVSGMADNVLKPLMLGRGVEAPMPVILLGALGGMAAAGILGMFVGAVLLALGYQIFMGWVAAEAHAPAPALQPAAQAAPIESGTAPSAG